MFTRCFERNRFDSFKNKEVYEVINLSQYGFEWYEDNRCVKTGLVEDLEETIEALKEEGFEEVI